MGKKFNAQMLHASGLYYSHMVYGPNFEFRKVIRNFWHQDTGVYFLELIQGAFWEQNGKNDVSTKMSVES